MTTRHTSVFDILSGYGTRWERKYDLESGNSPRVNGRLVLRENDLSMSVHERTRVPYTIGRRDPGNESFVERSTLIPVRNGLHPFRQDVLDEALHRWYKKAGGLTTNLAEMYATRVQAVDMVTSTVNRLVHAIRAVKKLDWRNTCRHLGLSVRRPRGWRGQYYTPDELWLEYQYGWKPLIKSVYDITMANYRDPGLTIRAFATRTIGLPDESGQYGKLLYTARSEVTYKASVVGTIHVDSLPIATGSQLGISNPMALAWEILPFSFVVDWFLPVGPYLEQLTALAGTRIINGSYSQSSYNAFGSNATGLEFDKVRRYYFIGPAAMSWGYNTQRRRVVGFPPPPLPVLKNPISLGHFANALALLAGAVKGTNAGRSKLY